MPISERVFASVVLLDRSTFAYWLSPGGFAFSVSANNSPHLRSALTLAMAAAKLANMEVGKPNSANLQNNTTRAKAAEMLNRYPLIQRNEHQRTMAGIL